MKKNSEGRFRILWGVETSVFMGIVAGIVFMEAEAAAKIRLFELLGAVSAAMITTYGVHKMKILT